MDRTIGFCRGGGYCIKCGKHFGYNDLHPEVICNICKSLPKNQTTLNNEIKDKIFCHNCGGYEYEIEDKHPHKKGYGTLRCKKCGEFSGFGKVTE